MNKSTNIISCTIKIVIALAIISITACKQTTKAPPLPYMASEYEQPKTFDYSITESDSIKWQTIDYPGLEKIPKIKFDMATLPSKPIDIDNVHSIKGVPTTEVLNWNNLTSSKFDYGSLPTQELKIKVKKLGAPTVEKAGPTTVSFQNSRGIYNLETSFGLQGSVTTVFKDKNNYIWFGGTSSIVKYDSNQLEIYGIEQGFQFSNVQSIFEDSKGRLWVGDNNDLTFIDFEAKLIHVFVGLFPAGDRTYTIFEDNQGKIWAGGWFTGLKIIDLDNKEAKLFSVDQGLQDNGILNIDVDAENNVWINTRQGINILNFEKGSNTVINKDSKYPISGGSSFLRDNKGNLFIGHNDGLYILNPNKTSITFYTRDNINDNFGGIIRIIQDHEDNYWLGTFQGNLFSLNLDQNLFENFKLGGQQSAIIYNIVEGNNGLIWFSNVNGGGIYYLDRYGYRPGNFNATNGLEDGNVWGTLEDYTGKVWIGTYNGIDIYNPNTGNVQHLSPNDGLIAARATGLMEDSNNRIWSYSTFEGINIIDQQNGTIQHLLDSRFFNDDFNISEILEINPNEFVLGSFGGEIYLLNENDNTLKKFELNNASTTYWVDGITIDSKNRIWIATREEGVAIISEDFKTLSWVKGETGLLTNQTSCITSNDNDIWLGTQRGVQKLNIQDKSSITFTKDQGLPANDIYSIKTNGNDIYAGSSKGFTRISYIPNKENDSNQWTLKSIGYEQGLNYVDVSQNSISFDKKGRLWAGVESQILTVIELPTNDTVPPNAFITGFKIFDKEAKFTTNTDSLWKLTENDKILSTNEKDILYSAGGNSEEKPSTSEMTFAGVEGPYNLPKNLELKPDKNFISFDYMGLQYKNQDKISFTYFLEGLDKTWSPITKETTTENYRDLPAGNYTFKVAAKNDNNIWSKPAEFNFTILPYWWQTWWAYLLFALVGSAILWRIIQYRSQWLKRENRLLEEKVSLRTTELRRKINQLKETQNQLIQSEKMASLGELTAGIAHEIQNPLNFVNNFSEINKELIDELQDEIKKGRMDEAFEISTDIKNNEDKIIHHGKRADSIVKGMLMHSRNHSGQKEFTDINALCDEYLRLSYHGLRAKDKSFNATMETEFDPSIKKVEIVPQDIGRVILNLLNNAFYAVQEKGKILNGNFVPKVKISTEKEDGKIKIKIQDNGNGIPQTVQDKIFQPFFTTKSAGHGTGLGLSLSYDIIKAHNGIITLDTKENEGTTFQIEIPENKKSNDG
ncbi:two-component regulator propeller domain-containing protein [Aegicerativicinus sediminis]|uniref:two-component regulator propeller domain-containing protein n=1 Tax=Aegicerativicinus sediminis TaxID=2893202 RepID=UPI001E4D695D|nr:two-component regulator propeller domain-containing protein [Aegicerativicinus sediminis]